MDMELANKKVLIFAGPDFEDRELFYPLYRFREAGAEVRVAGLGDRTYKGKYGVTVDVDGPYEDYVGQKWDIIVIPGGWAPDKIRMNESALQLVKDSMKQSEIAAAICHAGWVLASAGVVEGRTLTSFRAIRDDMINAGANWVDRDVVVDKKSCDLTHAFGSACILPRDNSTCTACAGWCVVEKRNLSKAAAAKLGAKFKVDPMLFLPQFCRERK